MMMIIIIIIIIIITIITIAICNQQLSNPLSYYRLQHDCLSPS